MKKFSVNVLGTIYNVSMATKHEHEKFEKTNSDAYCDHVNKQIYVQYYTQKEYEEDIMLIRPLNDYTLKNLRHELIHAFLYESGLHIESHSTDCWSKNEEMIDWLAIQFHKIASVVEASQKEVKRLLKWE